jgi:hypothetical protein
MDLFAGSVNAMHELIKLKEDAKSFEVLEEFKAQNNNMMFNNIKTFIN